MQYKQRNEGKVNCFIPITFPEKGEERIVQRRDLGKKERGTCLFITSN